MLHNQSSHMVNLVYKSSKWVQSRKLIWHLKNIDILPGKNIPILKTLDFDKFVNIQPSLLKQSAKCHCWLALYASICCSAVEHNLHLHQLKSEQNPTSWTHEGPRSKCHEIPIEIPSDFVTSTVTVTSQTPRLAIWPL